MSAENKFQKGAPGGLTMAFGHDWMPLGTFPDLTIQEVNNGTDYDCR
jgi:hypothetical protein